MVLSVFLPYLPSFINLLFHISLSLFFSLHLSIFSLCLFIYQSSLSLSLHLSIFSFIYFSLSLALSEPSFPPLSLSCSPLALSPSSDYCHLLPEGTVPRRFPSFGHTVPVSASSGEGIPHLRQLLRQSLEEQEDQATESQRRDKLHDLRRVTSGTSSTLPRPAANPKWGLSYDA